MWIKILSVLLFVLIMAGATSIGTSQKKRIEDPNGNNDFSAASPASNTSFLRAADIFHCDNFLHFCSYSRECDFFLQHVSCRCLHNKVAPQLRNFPADEYCQDVESRICRNREDGFRCKCDVSASNTTLTSECPDAITTTSQSVLPSVSTTPAKETTTTTTTTVYTIQITEENSAVFQVDEIIEKLDFKNFSGVENDKLLNEKAASVLSDLSQVISSSSVDENVATKIFDFFGSLSSNKFTPQITTEITNLADVLLGTMTLENSIFERRTNYIFFAAVDLKTKISSHFTFSLSGGLNSSSASNASFITLPPELLLSNQRLAFSGYDNPEFFRTPETTETLPTNFSLFAQTSRVLHVINSGVVGATVNRTPVVNLTSPVHLGLPFLLNTITEEKRKNQTSVKTSLYNPRCVFFDYTKNDGIGGWSTDGCITKHTTKTGVECFCNHLTNFAVLMSVETKVEDSVLDILTYVGCIFSIVGLMACILTYSVFRHLRKHKSQQILLNFCIALCGVFMVYLFNISASIPSNQAQCTTAGFFLHFFTSSTFCWMLIEILHMYMMFVNIWHNANNLIKKAWAFGWGVPLFFSLITLAIHFILQSIYPEDIEIILYPLYRETVVCWMTTFGFRWAFLLPIGILVIINLFLFAVVLYHVTCKRAAKKSSLTRRRSSKHAIKVREHVINAIAILLLSGPTWIVGFFINIDPSPDGESRRILSYVFVIINVFQGLWVFVVFTLRPKMVRAAWKNFICRSRKIKLTHHSSSAGSGIWAGERRTKSTSVKSLSVKSQTSAEMHLSLSVQSRSSSKPEEDSHKDFIEQYSHSDKAQPQHDKY